MIAFDASLEIRPKAEDFTTSITDTITSSLLDDTMHPINPDIINTANVARNSVKSKHMALMAFIQIEHNLHPQQQQQALKGQQHMQKLDDG